MVNRSLFCKYGEKRAIIMAGIVLRRKKNFIPKKKIINLFLNIGVDSNLCIFSEKQLEKEINFLLNNIIHQSVTINLENLLILDIYLIIIKIEENLVLKSINCILFILCNLGIKPLSLVSNIFFSGYKIFNNLIITSFKKVNKKKMLWNIITSRIEFANIVYNINAIGLFSFKFFIRIVLYCLNIKSLIKFFHYLRK